MRTKYLKFKRLFPLLALLLLPIMSYGQGQENAVGFLLNSVLFFLFSITALSIYLCRRYYIKRKGGNIVSAILISVVMALLSFLIIVTAEPTSGTEESVGFQEIATKQLLIGYALLLPNLFIIIIAPFIIIFGRKHKSENGLVVIQKQ